MILFLASENEGKKKEIEAYFPNWTILSPKDQNIQFQPVEDADSFLGNALIKAKLLWDQVKQPVIADDSGICVKILNNRPGIHSARYKGNTQVEKNNNLIEEVNQAINEKKHIPCPKLRDCFYVCALVYYFGVNKYFAVQETMEGQLLADIKLQKGSGGFGYDPIVYLPEYQKTVAELSNEEKNQISHRGKALRALQSYLH